MGIVVALIAAVVFLLNCRSCLSFDVFKPDNIRQFIQGFGPWAIVVYIILYTANTFSPFFPPIFIMSLAAGAIFEPVLGTVALTLGTFFGSTAAFFASRYLFRSRIEKLIQGKGKDIYEKLSRQGFVILLPIRIIGFPPYGVADFICGLSKMRYLDFALATMVGAIPWILPQVLLADRIVNFNPKDPVLWGTAIAFVLMIVITSRIVKKKHIQEQTL